MTFFIAGILLVLIALGMFSVPGTRRADPNDPYQTPVRRSRALGFVPLVLAVVCVAASCVSFIPTGYTGIVTTFGKVEDATLDAGLAIIAPWQDIVKMDNRVQETSVVLACFSSDIQEVDVAMSIGHRINQQNAMVIYKEIGKNYHDVVIAPQVQEAVKSVIAHYDASRLIESRDRASQEIDDRIRESLAAYNIELTYASITNIDFSDTFEAAVEAKVKAQQEKQQAEAVADKARVEAKAKADAAVIEAQAQAEMAKVAADAELYVSQQKAEANRILNESLTENLLQYYRITNVDALWDGSLPTYVGGETSIPVLNGLE